MATIHEVLRLSIQGGLSSRQIEQLGIASRSSVSNIKARLKSSGLKAEEALKLSEAQLQAKLFAPKAPPKSDRPQPDWAEVHRQLRQKGMTRLLLWQEYKARHPEGFGYTQFKHHYNRYQSTLNPSMRQIHYAGDKCFVDFSGLTVPLVDPVSGQIRKAQIFVAVLGASGYTFVHAVEDQSTEAFIRCHVEAFAFYGGVPNQIVCDNLKAAVIRHRGKEIRLNESYADMGRHYGVAIVPARPYRPQDKGKVEAGVKGIQRWILMRLRHQSFFDIESLNEAIGPLLDHYNAKKIRRLGQSRLETFNAMEREALHPLPKTPYLYREHKRMTVGIDYHVELEGCGYSVPYQHLGKKVDVWYSWQHVSIVSQGEVLALHPRLHRPGEDSTLPEHMPPAHRAQHEKWHPQRILTWARSIGEQTAALMEEIMAARTHPARGYRSCLAILNFAKRYGEGALEEACSQARALKLHKVSAIERLLNYPQSHQTSAKPMSQSDCFNTHENLRDAAEYR